MSNSGASIDFKWAPIKDFDGDPKQLTDGELVSLKRVWDREKQFLDTKALGEFLSRLKREWSIETGIVENIYTLDRGVTRNLIDIGIDATLIPHDSVNRSPEAVARVIQDQLEVLEEMFDSGARELTVGYIKELHSALLRNQDTYTAEDADGKLVEAPLERGAYKKLPNSSARADGSAQEYCPPEHVAAEMDRLIELHRAHRASGVPVEVEAAWLHHRFTQIHPFTDGNGRVARAIATLVLIQEGLFPFLISRDDLASYLGALESGDAGDLQPLVTLLVDKQRATVVQATEVDLEPEEPDSAEDAIAAVRHRLSEKHKARAEWGSAKATANHVADLAAVRLDALSDKLFDELDSEARRFRFDIVPGQAVDVAGLVAKLGDEAGIDADLREYERSVSLMLDTGKADWLHVSFYAIGPRFRGLIGVVGHVAIHDESDARVAPERFLINYEEARENANGRFLKWLERVLIHLLDEWRQTL